MLTRISFLLLAANSCIAQDNICSSETDRFGSIEQVFPTFSVPCPAVGDRVVVGLSYQVPPSKAAQLVTAVSHEGEMPIDGISVGRGSPFYEGLCEDVVDDWDGYFFHGEGKENCLDEDTIRLCTSVSQNSLDSIEFIDISVWNSGGCEGNLLFEAKVYEIGSDDRTEVNCLSEMEVICEDLPSGTAGPYFNSTAANIELATANVCETVYESSTGVDQLFPSLTVPCPAIGERVNAAMHFRNPLGGASSITVAARHEGKRPEAGISLGRSFDYDGDCDDLEPNFDDFFHKGEVDGIFCRDSLDGDSRLCEGGPITGPAFEENRIVFSVWNDGGCDGNLILEALVSPWAGGATTCLSGVELVCPVVNAGEGGPFYNATEEGEETPTSESTSLSLVDWKLSFLLMIVMRWM